MCLSLSEAARRFVIISGGQNARRRSGRALISFVLCPSASQRSFENGAYCFLTIAPPLGATQKSDSGPLIVFVAYLFSVLFTGEITSQSLIESNWMATFATLPIGNDFDWKTMTFMPFSWKAAGLYCFLEVVEAKQKKSNKVNKKSHRNWYSTCNFVSLENFVACSKNIFF
jgi:hypothetical protein